MKILKAKIRTSFCDKSFKEYHPSHATIASNVKPEGETLLTVCTGDKVSSLKRDLVAAGFEHGEEVVIMSAVDFAVFRRIMEV